MCSVHVSDGFPKKKFGWGWGGGGVSSIQVFFFFGIFLTLQRPLALHKVNFTIVSFPLGPYSIKERNFQYISGWIELNVQNISVVVYDTAINTLSGIYL